MAGGSAAGTDTHSGDIDTTAQPYLVHLMSVLTDASKPLETHGSISRQLT